MGMYPAGNIIKVQPAVLATSYSSNTLLFAKTELKNIVPSRGGTSLIRNISAHSATVETDVDLRLLFFDNDTSLTIGAGDALSGISGAEFVAAGFIGGSVMDFSTQDIDVGNGRVYVNSRSTSDGGMPLLIKAGEGLTSIWVACIHNGNPNYDTTSDLTLTFNVQYLG